MNLPVLVISSPGTPRFLIERTVRKLLQAGVSLGSIFHQLDSKNPQEISVDTTHGVILMRAGCWPVLSEPFAVPPSSATGRPVIAFGAVRSSHDVFPVKRLKSEWRKRSNSDSDRAWFHWEKLLQMSGGDLQDDYCRQQLATWNHSCWIDSSLTENFIYQLNQYGFSNALRHLVQNQDTRLIQWQPLDVYHDENLRVAQVITSLQRGGAERIAMDLHRWWLRSDSITPLLIPIHAPTRNPFPTPACTVELAQIADRAERWRGCERIVKCFTADVVHTHLLTRHEHQFLRKTGGRIVATIHNARSGWQSGTEQLEEQDLDLLIACSQAVERDLQAAGIQIPTRTVWNGINVDDYQSGPEFRRECRNRLIEQWSLPNNSIMVAALANPRPQKRLERLPAILRLCEQMLRANGDSRPIHLLIAGEPSQGNKLAEYALQQIHEQVSQWSFENQIHWLGCIQKTRELLAGIDILVSPSDYEGLSLAHLEALGCGSRVVATDVGGTSEINARCDGVHLVAAPSDDEEFATRLTEAIRMLPSPLEKTYAALSRDFSSIRMRDGYDRHYKRLANRPDLGQVKLFGELGNKVQRKPKGVLLVTNNFSTGGAQSSARRLLIELKARGYHVRAAVLQEDVDNPTLGRQVLNRHSIDVMCLPKAGGIDPLVALEPLFDSIDNAMPESVFLWNVIPEYKMLIADSLRTSKLFDVSPGEMNLQSLERYFENPRPGLPYRSYRDYGRRLDGAVVKHEGERQIVEAAFGVPVTVIPNGVVIPDQYAGLEPKEKLVIGTAARISPQKRLEDLIESFKLIHDQMPAYEFRIAGGVERGAEQYFSDLQQRSIGLPIQWIGELSETQSFLLQLDLFVMISEPAGCPNASLEAMAAGLPIIATDYGGVKEQVIDQCNGLLIANRDPSAFGQAIVRLALSQDLRKQYGKASRQRARQRFSLDRMASDYLNLMQLNLPNEA